MADTDPHDVMPGTGPATTRILIATDKFKGSLTGAEVARALSAGLRHAHTGVEVDTVPVADGGDGTLAAALASGFHAVPVEASGPTGERLTTAYARSGDRAVVEMADVSGLLRLPSGRPTAPLTATSRGTGEVIAAAVDAGCRQVILGIGGSASTDGGVGLLQALGARMLDSAGCDIGAGGAALTALHDLDLRSLRERMQDVRVTVACDVDNPLTGRHGAAAVYGPQKGATPGDVATLDAALTQLADRVAEVTGTDHRNRPGAGAAGGVGFAALALLDAELQPGIDLVLDLVDFERRLTSVDLVITGEGRLDSQTLNGKAPAGVAAVSRRHNVPVVAVCGHNDLGSAAAAALGVRAVYALSDLEPDLDRCVRDGAVLLEQLGARLAFDLLGTAGKDEE